ncbi:MAG: dTDP-4-dehydrorhamnose 3,5-epimerase [Pseudomonadota bacterium]
MLDVQKTSLDGVLILTPARFGDDRGFFSETYNERRFIEAGVDIRFVQDNHSRSVEKGTVRGLHYQAPPFAQAKLVRVAAGKILDVAVDARASSPTFGKHIAVELSAENGAQLFVPEGFLHGFATLEPDTHVIYKVNNYYDRDSDGAVRWNDPDLAIDWGVDEDSATLSEKDAAAPFWKQFKSPF